MLAVQAPCASDCPLGFVSAYAGHRILGLVPQAGTDELDEVRLPIRGVDDGPQRVGVDARTGTHDRIPERDLCFWHRQIADFVTMAAL